MRQNHNPPQFEIHWQLLLIVLVGVAFWAVFYRWAPNWALWTIASMLGIGVSIALGAGYKRAAGRKKQADETLHRAELQETINRTQSYCDKSSQTVTNEAWNNADTASRAAIRKAQRTLSQGAYVGQYEPRPSQEQHLGDIKDVVLRKRLYENCTYIIPGNRIFININEKTPLDIRVLDGLTIDQINSIRHQGENHEKT